MFPPKMSGVPLLGPDHKSQQFIFTLHYTQTHISLVSNIICMPFISGTDTRVQSCCISVRLFCVCSVYKYGPERALMAPASNKQRAEKPPIPAFLWPKSWLDGHPTSSRWTFSRRPAHRYQICKCVCMCVSVYVWISERASKTERKRGFWYIPHVARSPDTTTPRHKEECYEKERRRGRSFYGWGERSVSCWEFNRVEVEGKLGGHGRRRRRLLRVHLKRALWSPKQHPKKRTFWLNSHKYTQKYIFCAGSGDLSVSKEHRPPLESLFSHSVNLNNPLKGIADVYGPSQNKCCLSDLHMNTHSYTQTYKHAKETHTHTHPSRRNRHKLC